jgi:hypothetical protein
VPDIPSFVVKWVMELQIPISYRICWSRCSSCIRVCVPSHPKLGESVDDRKSFHSGDFCSEPMSLHVPIKSACRAIYDWDYVQYSLTTSITTSHRQHTAPKDILPSLSYDVYSTCTFSTIRLGKILVWKKFCTFEGFSMTDDRTHKTTKTTYIHKESFILYFCKTILVTREIDWDIDR